MRLNAGLHDFEDYSPIPVGTYEFMIKEADAIITPSQVLAKKFKKLAKGKKVTQHPTVHLQNFTKTGRMQRKTWW